MLELQGAGNFPKGFEDRRKKKKEKKKYLFFQPCSSSLRHHRLQRRGWEGRKLPQPRCWAEHPKTFCCVPGEMKLSRDGDGEGWQRGAGSALGSLCPAFPPWFSFPRCSWLRGTRSAHETQISERGGGPERDQLPVGRGWGPAARPKGPPFSRSKRTPCRRAAKTQLPGQRRHPKPYETRKENEK